MADETGSFASKRCLKRWCRVISEVVVTWLERLLFFFPKYFFLFRRFLKNSVVFNCLQNSNGA